MSIISSESEILLFGVGKPPALKSDNISILNMPHGKYLGVHWDPQLNFRKLISYVAKK